MIAEIKYSELIIRASHAACDIPRSEKRLLFISVRYLWL